MLLKTMFFFNLIIKKILLNNWNNIVVKFYLYLSIIKYFTKNRLYYVYHEKYFKLSTNFVWFFFFFFPNKP